MEKNIKNIYNDCKSSPEEHARLLKKLMNFYLESEFEVFCDQFICLVKYALNVKEKLSSDRILILIAKFVAYIKSEEKKEEVINKKLLNEGKNIGTEQIVYVIFEFLLKNHETCNVSVRYRVCRLINRIFNIMNNKLHLKSNLNELLKDTMMNYLIDQAYFIRVQAVHVLSHFQDLKNDCAIIKAFRFHLSFDPRPEVRIAILKHIVITSQTLPEILEKIRDVEEIVRKQVYLILAENVHIRTLTIKQRICIIDEGLKDRSPIIRHVLKKNVLPSWLKIVDGNFLKFLGYLNVEGSSDCAESALKSLFDSLSSSSSVEKFELLDESKLIPCDNLTSESSFYWKFLFKYLRSEKSDSLNTILPDLSAFCEYVTKYVETLPQNNRDESPEEALQRIKSSFIIQQLIEMTAYFDMEDKAGYNQLCELVHHLLVKPFIDESCIKAVWVVFSSLYSPSVRVNKMIEIISDIRGQSENTELNSVRVKREIMNDTNILREYEISEDALKIRLGQIRLKMKWTQEELDDCIRDLNIEKIVLLKEALNKQEMEEKTILEKITLTVSLPKFDDNHLTKSDDEKNEKHVNSETVSRCLLIFCEFLFKSDVVEFDTNLMSLFHHLILPSIKSENLSVRKYAVRGLALCCLFSKALAKQHILLLFQILKIDVEDIQSEALQGLFDIWLLHGFEEFYLDEDQVEISKDNNGESPSGEAMKKFLSNMITENDGQIRILAVQGLCKLLLSSQIRSSKLLSLLLVLLYNPTTKKDVLLKQILGAFFPLYANISKSREEIIALISALNEVTNLSALSELDVDDMINFLVTITSPSISSNNLKMFENTHDILTQTICSEILAYPDKLYIRSLAKNLNHLILPSKDLQKLQKISCLAQKITRRVQDKVTKQYAKKFSQKIKDLINAYKVEEAQNKKLNNSTIIPLQFTSAEKISKRSQQNQLKSVKSISKDGNHISDPQEPRVTRKIHSVKEIESSRMSARNIEGSRMSARNKLRLCQRSSPERRKRKITKDDTASSPERKKRKISKDDNTEEARRSSSRFTRSLYADHSNTSWTISSENLVPRVRSLSNTIPNISTPRSEEQDIRFNSSKLGKKRATSLEMLFAENSPSLPVLRVNKFRVKVQHPIAWVEFTDDCRFTE